MSISVVIGKFSRMDMAHRAVGVPKTLVGVSGLIFELLQLCFALVVVLGIFDLCPPRFDHELGEV